MEKIQWEERFILFLDKWDAFQCTIAPEIRYRRSIKRIARKWERELMQAEQEFRKDQSQASQFYFRVHMPHDALHYLPDNYFTLSFWSIGFQLNNVSKERTTLFWVKYKKHPAYAVYDMTGNDEFQILNDIKNQLTKNKKSSFDYHIQHRDWVMPRFSSSGISQEWELVATLNHEK